MNSILTVSVSYCVLALNKFIRLIGQEVSSDGAQGSVLRPDINSVNGWCFSCRHWSLRLAFFCYSTLKMNNIFGAQPFLHLHKYQVSDIHFHFWRTVIPCLQTAVNRTRHTQGSCNKICILNMPQIEKNKRSCFSSLMWPGKNIAFCYIFPGEDTKKYEFAKKNKLFCNITHNTKMHAGNISKMYILL